MKDQPDYTAKVLTQLAKSMSGWLAIESIAYGLRTSVANVRPTLDAMAEAGALQTRKCNGRKEWAKR